MTSAGSGGRANGACRTAPADPPTPRRCAARRPRPRRTDAFVRHRSSRCRGWRLTWHGATPIWRRADDVWASAALSRLVWQPLKMPRIRRPATQPAVRQKTLVHRAASAKLVGEASCWIGVVLHGYRTWRTPCPTDRPDAESAALEPVGRLASDPAARTARLVVVVARRVMGGDLPPCPVDMRLAHAAAAVSAVVHGALAIRHSLAG